MACQSPARCLMGTLLEHWSSTSVGAGPGSFAGAEMEVGDEWNMPWSLGSADCGN